MCFDDDGCEDCPELDLDVEFPEDEPQPDDVDDEDIPHDFEPDPGEMDGDHESGLASAGWGTDEDYGGYDDPGDW